VTRRALSVLQMDEVRARFAQGLVCVPALAREYGVGEKTIRRVLREAPSEYGKARRAKDHQYSTSSAGRARRRRADQKHGAKADARSKKNASRRKRAYGLTPEDVQKMLQEQNYTCPLTERPVDERSAVDHAWDVAPPYAVRGIIHPGVNPWIGRTDADLAKFTINVMKYNGKRVRLRLFLGCGATPKKSNP